MASRRAPSTRNRTNTQGSMPPPALNSNRPRSALAKSNSSLRSGLATPIEEVTSSEAPGPSTRITRQHVQNAQDESETNIRVVVRCRRRSEREVSDSSPIIVATSGPKGHDITIQTAAPVSSLGVVTLPPTRTYPFDTVFGPEADQAMIYHDVVGPMLDEVLQGYNCTLFAYGQTGTGKTFTMQGDLSTTPMGNPSPQAGMIPRVLFRLFHQLESSGADYSVKISFIELYNEELRDLLVPDLAAPVGSTQPMGMGAAKDAAGQGNLKIFDDSSKKGVFIQGLEEACVKDAADALALLTKGSQRRQIAATKFNDHSSRSHSVFSVTVHVKETSSIGEDLLKVGKLNLVDLAGSENIGRSGAENKRAREAGMINQSLLTLGRVINALVDGSSHVPYRESKLTRLLQDSLGGRTKTCIIATISPARCNMEETLSTLDYAIRAKSIRNRPEVNQRMTRNSLLKEYVAEVERLKADLYAAREKNGIYMSEESLNEMNAEKELLETEKLEAQKQVEIHESQIRNLREEFEQSIAMLMKKDGELKETRERLKQTEGHLDVAETQLQAAKGALEEEIVVRQAHQDTEVKLADVARGLREVTQESLGDLDRLHSKLGRLATLFNSNKKVVNSNGKTLSAETQVLETELDTFFKTSNQHVQQMRTGTEQFQAKERETLSAFSKRLDEELEKLRSSLETIHSREEASGNATATVRAAMSDVLDNIKKGFNAWTITLQEHSEQTCHEAEASSMAGLGNVEAVISTLGSLIELIVQEAQTHIADQRKLLQEAKALADSNAAAEIQRLRAQNALLVGLLESETQKSQRDKEEVAKQISDLLDNRFAERDRSLREAFSELTGSNAKAEVEIAQSGSDQSQSLEKIISRGRQWSADLEQRGGEGKRTRDGGLKTLSSARTVVRDGLADVQTSVMDSTSLYSSELQRQTQKFATICDEGFDRLSRIKRARMEATDAMATDAQSGYKYMQRGIASTSRLIEAASARVISEGSSLASASETCHKASTVHLANLRRATQTIIEEGTREDSHTGLTPRKRKWTYVDEWQRTKNREALLKDWRRQGQSIAKRDTFLAEHLPLPEEEDAEGLLQDAGHKPAEIEEEIEEEQELENLPPSDDPPPYVKSLSSSASSTATSLPPPPVLGSKKQVNGLSKSGLPIMGTLTERSTNVIVPRGSRRLLR